MKIDRLLAIVLLLLNRRKVTAQELSERFEVSVRTIYRDIDSIDAAGIPIVSHQGNNGGFSIMDSYRLEKQLLTPEDIMSMVSVLKGVGNALGDSRVLHSGKKIESLYPRDGHRDLTDDIRIELSPWGYRGGQDALLEVVRKAIQQRKVVRFAYRNSEGECLERSAEPMTLVFKGSAWYLFAYCRLRSDFRLFRLSRIRDLFVADTAFERKPYGYDKFAARFEGAVGEAELCEINFSPRMRFMAEDGFPPDQIAPREDGWVTVRAPIHMGDWVLSWLLSFGADAEVVSPLYLREMLKDRAAKVVAQYTP